VDDEPQITRVLRTSLDAHGYDARVANDGDTALQIARDWAPDLMITDLSMPVMDGLELCRRFRLKSNAPIIVLSVKGEERVKVQALDAGADDYVTKPLELANCWLECAQIYGARRRKMRLLGSSKKVIFELTSMLTSPLFVGTNSS
jgi:two-component system KDP operon response regulator KdpE